MSAFRPYDAVPLKDVSLRDQRYSETAFVKESERPSTSAREALQGLWTWLSNGEEVTKDAKETINTALNLIRESMILQILEGRGVRNIPRVLKNEHGLPGSQSGLIEDGKLVTLLTGKGNELLFASLALNTVKGETWDRHKFVTGEGFMDEQALLTAGMKAAEVFDEIYKAGFVHNDIKPSNLMIDTEGKITVIDFNAAERHEGGICWSNIATPLYAAPERIDPMTTDRRENKVQYKVTGDIYSFALTLAEKAGLDITTLINTNIAHERGRIIFLQNLDNEVRKKNISEKLAVFLVWNTDDSIYRNSDFSECVEALRIVANEDSNAEDVRNFFLGNFEKRQQAIAPMT